MKNVKFIFIAYALLSVLAAQAQSVGNVGFGGNFMGSSKIVIQGAENHGVLYENVYQPLVGGTVFYETIQGGMTHLLEVSYLMGKLKDVEQGDYYLEGWDTSTFQPLKAFSLFYYGGGTFGAGNRLQIPLYLGIGVINTSAEPIKTWSYNIGAKARVKFYLTDRIGVFAGANWKRGLGNVKVNVNETRGTSQRYLGIEAGVTFSLSK